MEVAKAATILVVDDEEDILNYVARYLRNGGYRVVTARSGEDALVVLQQQNFIPQVVITDIVLPGMSGFALSERLRGANPNLKTLFTSGYTEAECRNMMKKISTADVGFLQKPVSVDALLQKVQELVTEHPTRGQRANRE